MLTWKLHLFFASFPTWVKALGFVGVADGEAKALEP